MAEEQEVSDLEQLLDRIQDAARENEQVSLSTIMEKLGDRSFGPWLLLAGIITWAPVIGGIPGVPTLMAVVVLLISAQLVSGRHHLWLPRWVLARSLSRGKVEKGLEWTRRPARWVDRLLRPRLVIFVRGIGLYSVAVLCLAIAVALPPTELVPFSANAAGFALTAYGLALMAQDGLVALIASVFTLTTLGAIIYGLA